MNETSAAGARQTTVTFEARVEDFLQAAAVFDLKNRVNSRRSLELLGVMVLLLMFVPALLKQPDSLANWVMTIAGVILGLLVWKYPAYANRQFARRRAMDCPEYTMTVTADGIDVLEGPASYHIAYSDHPAVWEYRNVFAICHEKNRLLAIPKDQLGEEVCGQLRGLFSQGLGDRYENVYSKEK